MEIEIYLNTAGQECVKWTDENGAGHSMLKSAYDELKAAKEASGTLS
jgi:hypothetical protein